MSERENSSITVRAASGSVRRVVRNALRRSILALAALAALVFVSGGPSRAQSQSATSKSASAGASTPIVVAPASLVPTAQATTPKPAVETETSAGQSAPKGQQEGIKIHGHWTIEVKNPDGSVVTHREFENGLATTNVGSGGAGLLAGVLGRVVTPGSWRVSLFNDAHENNAVIINEPNSSTSAQCPELQTAIQNNVGGVASCSNTLSVTGPQLGTGGAASDVLTGGTLTLTGSGAVPQNFPPAIGYVQTMSFLCPTSDSPVACSTDSNNGEFPFTNRTLDGLNGDPSSVPVTAGQTVAVTVVISFQ